MTNYTGPQLRDQAIARAIDHADAVVPTWSSVARQHLDACARRHAHFTTEDVRLSAEAQGFPAPPDNRAWGGVTRTAASDGVMSNSGTYVNARDAKCHHRPVVLWRSNLYRG